MLKRPPFVPFTDGASATITADPAFDATMAAYTASVANGVDRIMIEGSKGDDGAAVAYLVGGDSVLADAGGNAVAFQLDLDVGANTSKPLVTAEDAVTTETDTVVVTRGWPTRSRRRFPTRRWSGRRS